MQVHTDNHYRVAFFVSHEELSSCGLDESRVDGDWTRRRTMRLLDEEGIVPKGTLLIEVFPGQSGLMVFASLSPEGEQETSCFTFDTLDDVIACCASLNTLPLKSLLARCNGRYLLAVSDNAAVCAAFNRTASEFGVSFACTPILLLSLREQNAVLVPHEAVQKLAALH